MSHHGKPCAVSLRSLCISCRSLLPIIQIVCVCSLPRARAQRPIAAPCLPRPTCPMMTISARSQDRPLRRRVTLCPGTYRDMKGARGRAPGRPCWTLPRGRYSGSPVSVHPLLIISIITAPGTHSHGGHTPYNSVIYSNKTHTTSLHIHLHSISIRFNLRESIQGGMLSIGVHPLADSLFMYMITFLSIRI